MSYKELAKNLIDQIPDSKMYYIVSYLQGAAVPEEIPNVETLEAMAEVEEMITAGSGQHFHGTAEEFTEMLLAPETMQERGNVTSPQIGYLSIG